MYAEANLDISLPVQCITKHLTLSSECPLCRGPVKTVVLRKRADAPLSTAVPLPSPSPTPHAAASASSSAAAASPAASSAASKVRRASKDIVVVKARFNKHVYDVSRHTHCEFVARSFFSLVSYLTDSTCLRLFVSTISIRLWQIAIA